MAAAPSIAPLKSTYLQEEGFPLGLIHALQDLKRNCAQQIWLLDNSEPMNQSDGSVLSLGKDGKVTFEKGTRWDELKRCVKAHIQICAALQIHASFRLLNPPTDGSSQEFSICKPGDQEPIQTQVQKALEIMDNTKPHSLSPLTEAISKLATEIDHRQEELAKSGKHIAVILCTDGKASDSTKEFFVEQLKKWKDLPVQTIVRLCSDEPNVTEYYNKLDVKVGFRIDVLRDFLKESVEACRANPWLTYSLPLHRAREMGFKCRPLDHLDEKPLDGLEQRELCEVLFGKNAMMMCPSPELDRDGFLAHVKSLQQGETLQWDPILEEPKPWIDYEIMENPKLKDKKTSKMRHIQQKKKGKWFTGLLKKN